MTKAEHIDYQPSRETAEEVTTLDPAILATIRRRKPVPATLAQATDAARRATDAANRAVAHLEKATGHRPERRVVVGGVPAIKSSRHERKFNPQRQAQYLELLASGQRRSDAYKLIGIGSQTVRALRKNDPAFAEAEEFAEAEACDIVEEALWELARSNTTPGNLEAKKLWLWNRSPDRWKDPKKIIEVSGQIDTGDTGDRVERIRLLEARLEERAALRAATEEIIEAEIVDESGQTEGYADPLELEAGDDACSECGDPYRDCGCSLA